MGDIDENRYATIGYNVITRGVSKHLQSTDPKKGIHLY